MESAETRYTNSRRFVGEIVGALLPPERVSVADFAAAHRWLSNEGGGYVGRWQHEIAPYLVAPMQALTSDLYLTTAIVGPGQSGKTSVAENWFLTAVPTDPADMLWYMQTDDGIASYVKGRINPMIEHHVEELRARQGLRPVDDSIHFKRFRGMNIEFLSATPSNLINKRAPRIAADEVDAYPESLGDVKVLLDVRRQTYGDASMLLAMSHCDRAQGLDPKRDWNAGIMSIYRDSTRFLWWWACPHCAAWSSPAPIAARHMAIEFPDGEDIDLDTIEREARLICPVNGCLIEDRERRAMNLAAFHSPHGGWIGEGQEIAEDGTVTGDLAPSRTAGFWIVGAMSPFVMGGIGGLARARVKAKRDFENSGDDTTLREVMVKSWGVPYVPDRVIGSINANDLADRAETALARGTVPAGVRYLTLAVDCQLAHFEWLLRGWGVAGESWTIDTGRLPADPATNPADWDALIDLIDRAWPLADGSGRAMRVRAAGYDLQGAPGVTAQAYAAWSRWRARKRVRFLGTISGRDAFNVVPLQGAPGLQAPMLSVVYPDTARRGNRLAGGGQVPVARFNPNLFKDGLNGQLKRGEPGAWYVHVPAAFRAAAPPHPWFEQLVAEAKTKSGRWEKTQPTARNEALDLMVMTHVLAHLHGLASPHFDWDSPPSWAAPWDANTMIVAGPALSAVEGTGGDAASTPRATSPSAPSAPEANAARSLANRLA